MSNKVSVSVEYKVEHNGQRGDWCIVEYYDGVWNNEIDNNWREEEARLHVQRAEAGLIRLNDAMIAPHECITTLLEP